MRFWSGFLTLLVLVAIFGGAIAVGAKRMFEAEGPLIEATVVDVPKGSSLAGVAERFHAQGVISSEFVFRAAARIQGVSNRLQAGDYEIPARASMADVLRMLTTGEAIDYRITIAEGLSVAEALKLVEESPVLVGEITERPEEGWIAPETYFVRRGETRQVVVDRMVAAQREILDELWAQRAPDLPISTPEEALILASIVEKETGVPTERPEVASVFVNRLRKGWRLQSDPTIIYGITFGEYRLDRGLRRSEIDQETAYNTYRIDGLPPTPIANPGRAAIEATLRPATTDYMYFVADGTGGHAFAITDAEHQANVREWRRIERQRQADGG